MRGQGHCISSGQSGCSAIAAFPAGQWTRYIPAEEGTEDEQWLSPVAAAWSAIESKSKQLSNWQGSAAGDAAALYLAYRNATKHNKAGNR